MTRFNFFILLEKIFLAETTLGIAMKATGQKNMYKNKTKRNKGLILYVETFKVFKLQDTLCAWSD